MDYFRCFQKKIEENLLKRPKTTEFRKAFVQVKLTTRVTNGPDTLSLVELQKHTSVINNLWCY